MNFIENESATKLRGAYYTPSAVARFLVRWVLEAKPRRVLEPACGDGAFLAELEAAGFRGEAIAHELDPVEAGKARARAPSVDVEVRTGDFLEWALDEPLREDLDAAVGNPPFVRYQYLAAEHQERARRIFLRRGLRFTKHTNAWVPFVIAALERLRPGGRLAFVVPAELLHVLHAQPLRTFLVETCRSLVVDSPELRFPGVLQGVVLLLAEKGGSGVAIVPRFDERALREATWHEGLTGKWMPALLGEEERALLDGISEKVHRFSEVASVDVGIVTGANHFFLVDDATVEEFGLEPWAHPMFGRSEHARGVTYDAKAHEENRRRGRATNFLWLDEPIERFPPSVREYIRRGEAEGLHRRYKCRIREPWYLVPSVSSAPVAMLKRCHAYPRLILNEAGAFTTDTAYRVRPRRGVSSEALVAGFVSSLTALSAELEGRHYGGGVLELVPSEIEKLLVALPSKPRLRELDVLERNGGESAVLEKQDARVLARIATRREREVLRGAWQRLAARRRHRTS